MMNRAPDVEVYFEFNGRRGREVYDGYRPAHRVKDDYLTTGVHHYYNTEIVENNGSAMGTITFLTPEAYPQCLWIGKRITVQEGGRIVGYAEIRKIFNPLFQKEDMNDE